MVSAAKMTMLCTAADGIESDLASQSWSSFDAILDALQQR